MTARAHALLDGFASLAAIDTNGHLGQWPYRLTAAATTADLQNYAERHGLRTIWVSHLAALFGFDTRTGNEACARECVGASRLAPFAVLNPLEQSWVEEFSWAMDAGFTGVRIAPGYHGYPLSEALPLARACAVAAVPLQVLARLDDERVRHPQSPARDLALHHIADFIRLAPALPLVLSGLNWNEWNELRRHLGDEVPPHVRLDLWHVNGPSGVADLLADEPERWMFGSGYPLQTPEATMLQLAASGLTREVLHAISRQNAEGVTAHPREVDDA